MRDAQLMRVVADTNTVVSGLLWHGPPRLVLDAARSGRIELFTSAILLAELEDVLRREKFAQRLALANALPRELLLGYAVLASIIDPAIINPMILADPDDDAVLACAVGAGAQAIVSGDTDLLTLREYQGIKIVTASELSAEFQDGRG